MTTYSRPGTFVNQSLTPLATSPGGVTGGQVACFVGAYNIGPTQPTLVSSWQNFVNLYGGFAVANGSNLTYAVYQYFNNGGAQCYVYRVPNTDAVTAYVAVGSVEQTDAEPTDPTLLTFVANNPGAWANSLYVEIVPGAPSVTADPTSVFTLNVYKGGTTAGNLVETWPAVSLNPASARNLLALMNASTNGSAYLTAKVSFTSGAYVAGDGSSDPIGNSGSPAALASGADGSSAPALDTAITSGVTASGAHPWNCPGLSVLSNVVINVNLPAVTTQSVLNNVISWAQSQGNVFVIVDAPFGGVPLLASSAIVTSYSTFIAGGGTALTAAPCVAVYGPWLSIQDPASSSATATRWVAPGGAILGVWAQNDSSHNVGQTPAGTQATVSAAALETYFTPSDLNSLTTMQVNPVKLIPGAGFCVFGGRTLATGYPNRYVNVSRTLMQFTLDFVNITQFAIFQNNDAILWQSITTVLTSYLTQAMQANMLAGSTPETSFAVTCDDTTTTAAQAQAGIVNATVAVALVSPAEFIIINLSQMQGGGTATVSS